MVTMENDGLLRPREAAQWLKISERSLWTFTQRGELAAIRIGRSVRYAVSDLIAFVESRRRREAE